MAIKVMGPDAAYGPSVYPPNPPIPGHIPIPPSPQKAISTFNGTSPALGPIPAPNAPLPDASTVPPARVMTAGLPVVQVMPSSPPNVSGPPPISF